MPTSDPVLEELKSGIVQFQTKTYPELREMYQKAASEPQKPHTLFITCADSRIDAESITDSRPGELFITRNVGNMVPVHGEASSGVSAVIEYAVNALKVKHVVVCGHSDCGAMKGLLHPEALAALPEVKSWLENAADALTESGSSASDEGSSGESLPRLTERNVLLQLRHLRTHPAVADAVASGRLTLSGWVYEIGSGEIRISEDGDGAFHPVAATAVVA